MRALFVILLLAGCAAPATTSKPRAAPRPDGTCAEVAWSCVGVAPTGAEAWGCTEGNAVETARYQATCTAETAGRFALNPCLRDLAVGGCTLARGSSCTTTWYHAPATRDTVEQACARRGAMFVAP